MDFVYLVLWCITVSFCFGQKPKNNVCKTFEDLNSIARSENCWYNPDVFATPKQITIRHGFEFQDYTIETQDGYLLTVFRIQDKFASNRKEPILLHHGYLSTAMSFLSSGNQSLALYLASKGYDVWLANYRGNNYSNKHTKLKMSDKKFWDFSFHEIAIFDVPAVLEFIAKETGNFSKITFIGHSLGTTIGFVYAITLKEHADTYLKSFIALAPITTSKYSTSPESQFLPQMNMMTRQFQSNGIVVFFPNPERLSRIAVNLCTVNMFMCLTPLSLMFGADEGEYVPEDIMVFIGHHPGRSSVKSGAHMMQIRNAKRFQYYDYGLQKNLELYNSETPPIYDLSKITIPVHLFYAENDVSAGRKDVEWIFNELKNSPKKSIHVVPPNGEIRYNHLNFLIGKHIVPYFYDLLMEVLING